MQSLVQINFIALVLLVPLNLAKKQNSTLVLPNVTKEILNPVILCCAGFKIKLEVYESKVHFSTALNPASVTTKKQVAALLPIAVRKQTENFRGEREQTFLRQNNMHS